MPLPTGEKDGFASLQTNATSAVTTRPVQWDARLRRVFVNFKGDRLRVGVHRGGAPVAGLSLAACVGISSADSTRAEIRWHGVADLKAVAGQVVQLELEVTNGELFSFWLSEDKCGASRGPLAAGGPGAVKGRDVKGSCKTDDDGRRRSLIDRKALVQRHNPHIVGVNAAAAATVTTVAATSRPAVSWVQDRFAISFFIDPLVPPAQFDRRYAEVAGANFTLLINGGGAGTPAAVAAQIAACAKHDLRLIASTCGGSWNCGDTATNATWASSSKVHTIFNASTDTCTATTATGPLSNTLWGWDLRDEPSTQCFPCEWRPPLVLQQACCLPAFSARS